MIYKIILQQFTITMQQMRLICYRHKGKENPEEARIKNVIRKKLQFLKTYSIGK